MDLQLLVCARLSAAVCLSSFLVFHKSHPALPSLLLIPGLCSESSSPFFLPWTHIVPDLVPSHDSPFSAMADDSNNNLPTANSTSPTSARPKPVRSSTAGVVRTRSPPPPGSSTEQSNDRPPTKRARKAINCEPCRNSKLKCDR